MILLFFIIRGIQNGYAFVNKVIHDEIKFWIFLKLIKLVKMCLKLEKFCCYHV